MLVGKIRIGKERSELPSLGDAASLKPRLDGILAIGAGEFVVVIRGLQGSANFILALGKQSTVFGPERGVAAGGAEALEAVVERGCGAPGGRRDRKSTRLNSSHTVISYAVFCLKKKKNKLVVRT